MLSLYEKRLCEDCSVNLLLEIREWGEMELEDVKGKAGRNHLKKRLALIDRILAKKETENVRKTKGS